jgi:2,4-dienoyl-CoA reductase-like NADH-dependent reductase (Old Yellow Enzyme family)
MTSALFSPFRLADLNLANRIIISPMCQYSADDGVASDWHMTHLGMLANSGAGLLVVESTHVERSGRITHGCLGLYSDACEAALEKVVAHCRRIGSAKLAIQLSHAGRKASAQRPWEGGKALPAGEDPWPTIAPSAIPFGPDWHHPRAMSESDMAHVRKTFVEAARRAVRIGFDAVELHMAHGYLLHGFLSPLSNQRNDAWGGSPEGRMRFPLEVARDVRDAVPRGTPLGARLTGTDWLDGGLTVTDAVELAKRLSEAGLDYVDVSSGGVSTKGQASVPAEPGYNAALARQIRLEAGLPTRVVGLIVDPKQAEAVVAEGSADMVALARAFLDDPHWAWHAAQVLGGEVVHPPQYRRAAPGLWPGARLRAST